VPVLAGQAVHEVCPISGLYVPNGHFWQTEIDVPFVPAKYVPAGHGVHEPAPNPEYVPPGHDKHELCEIEPDFELYVPRVQL
jgi:hypothetical protein